MHRRLQISTFPTMPSNRTAQFPAPCKAPKQSRAPSSTLCAEAEHLQLEISRRRQHAAAWARLAHLHHAHGPSALLSPQTQNRFSPRLLNRFWQPVPSDPRRFSANGSAFARQLSSLAVLCRLQWLCSTDGLPQCTSWSSPLFSAVSATAPTCTARPRNC